MDSIDRLAQKIAEMHKQNRNPKSTAPVVGKVLSISPLRIQYGDNVLLEQEKLIVAERLMAGTNIEITEANMVGNDASNPATITFHREVGGDLTERIKRLSIPAAAGENNKVMAKLTTPLQEGDQVIMIPDQDWKKWYVLDKVWKESKI
ncbi:DUF2577 domain-containing protein [Brevibacillus composti]|uniref:DUF2577 domain-containing protein n=1 Tax=Brevibacillus composti TaxID=2796470 RepID=A0A7T5JP90_9BACL|nr:DUF2577 domain-containing protein [Brevibacillus composti]QQE75223.1 DUF2577 domain-containing protein [Brevibacillus composti]